MKRNVGQVGLGVMGSAFAVNLMKNGFEVVGYDIDAQKLAELEQKGLKPANSPADVGRKADVVITSLPTPEAFHGVMTGNDGLAGGLGPENVAEAIRRVRPCRVPVPRSVLPLTR